MNYNFVFIEYTFLNINQKNRKLWKSTNKIEFTICFRICMIYELYYICLFFSIVSYFCLSLSYTIFSLAYSMFSSLAVHIPARTSYFYFQVVLSFSVYGHSISITMSWELTNRKLLNNIKKYWSFRN